VTSEGMYSFIQFQNETLAMDSSPAAKRRRQSKDNEIESSTPLKQPPPVVIFAHGAGAPSSSDWMLRFHFLFFIHSFNFKL